MVSEPWKMRVPGTALFPERLRFGAGVFQGLETRGGWFSKVWKWHGGGLIGTIFVGGICA